MRFNNLTLSIANTKHKISHNSILIRIPLSLKSKMLLLKTQGFSIVMKFFIPAVFCASYTKYKLAKVLFSP